MKTLLLLTDWFVPGFRAGGPIRSSVNFAYAMCDHYRVYVLTGDRDLGDSIPYPGVQAGQWTDFDEGIRVFYLPQEQASYGELKAIIRDLNPEFLYLNSMYSKVFAIFPLLLRWRRQIPGEIVLAPRGMLNPSALRFKSLKKRVFLSLVRIFGLARKIRWHATNREEAQAIRAVFPLAHIGVAPNFPNLTQTEFRSMQKEPGTVRLFYLSRILPIKNLLSLLRALQKVAVRVDLTIAGPIEDQSYWQQCLQLAKSFSQNIRIVICGELHYRQIPQLLHNHHFFVLPTLGENFGHAIFEAFLAGRPVIISDRTPWRNLSAEGIGWDLPLEQPDRWVETIGKAAALDQEKFDQMAHRAWEFAAHFLASQEELKEKYFELFS
ncbi:MAG: glycosyltransferase [Saprospiraceae bacterium]|nr:glycosyltransferase [Saprospiraceae bacterium]MCB0681131.1 glycosyltransferase [Saprospiraceae bacterium]